MVTAGLVMITAADAQQNVISQKDNTRPGQAIPVVSGEMASLTVIRKGDANEISWTAMNEDNVRQYVVEYSYNGIDYQAAGNPVAVGAPYLVKHTLRDALAMLYRLKIEKLDGQFIYTRSVSSDGVVKAPVRIYPTIISGDMVNVFAAEPVQRLVITSGSGEQAFVKDINGQRDYIPVAIPSLAKGMYWVTFYGKGWKYTDKILMQ